MLCYVKSLQLCPTLCDPIDGSPPGSPVPEILQARTRVGCHFLLQCMKVKSESEVAQSCPTLATPWTAVHQAPLSMGFSRQEYWSGVPLPSLNHKILECILDTSSLILHLKKSSWGRTRLQRSRWMWSTSLSTGTSGIHLQTQKCMQNTSWERQENLNSGEEYKEPHKTW